MDYTNEQLKAAYALNLCTVSVSQIIDYDDINVMEQEYEAILNNLNLEQMPKDEALLKILKQILDTITFFRIQEGDKKFIEKEYQQKMKNAIWSAVPNIGLLVAGGSPVTMAVSLASQIGIGYMNYRKSKAEIELEDERQRWQLEQTAIEQFNGLRRELFDTAWRLSAEYNFPDKLRLTERQIKQYNNILMDGDLIRKYSRMDTIKDSFIAYPPFWYYFGNTANAIARSDMNLSDSTRAFYREKAKEYFIEYRHSNQQGLLREDTVSSSCALELVDLLDIETDKELIKDLLNEAIDYSGRENDVLQLAAVTYLKLNDREKAAELLSQLVNEEYNTVLNAQLLSSVYVSSYLKEPSEYVLGKYEILRNQVGESYLYPMPDNMDKELNDVEWEFVSAQKRVLREKYLLAIKSFVRKYTIRFIKIIPEYGEEKYSDMYLLGDPSAVGDRKYNMSKVFSNSRKAEEYKEMLREVGIDYAILDLLNDMFDSCCVLDVMSESIQEKLARDIETAILNNKSVLIELKNRLDDNSFDLFDMEKLLGVSFFDFTKDFFQDLMSEIGYYINSRNEMQDFAIAEQNLSEFCAKEEIPDPVVLFGKDGDNPEENEPVKEKDFQQDLFQAKTRNRLTKDLTLQLWSI